MRQRLQYNIWPLIIALTAIIVRLIYIFELSSLPDYLVLMVDEKWHWLWAEEIATKSFWGDGSYFRAPLYPYFLSLLYFITNGSILISKILQVLLCGGTAFYLYKLTDFLFGKRSAIWAGFIYSFYGILVFYETIFLIPVLFLFFIVWGMYRFIRDLENPTLAKWIITGLIFGCAAIARPNILMVMPFLAGFLFFKFKKEDLFKALKLPIILSLGIILVIIPVTVRNYIVTGEFMLISSQGGINLYLGNNPDSDGLTMMMPEVALNEAVSWDQFTEVTKRAAEKESRKSLTDSEVSSFWTSKAFDFMTTHPIDFITLCWKKTVFLFNGYENSDNANIYYQKNKSKLYSLLVWDSVIKIPFGLLLPFFFMGVYLRKRDFKKLVPIYIFILAYTPSIVLFLVTARHRLPLVILMIPIAAGGIVYFYRRIREFTPRMMVIMISLFLVCLILVNKTYYGENQIAGEFQVHLNAGIRFEKIEDYQNAEREYLIADGIFNMSPTLLNNLGYVQFRLGKHDKADKNFKRVLALDSKHTGALNNLGLLLKESGNYDSSVVLFKKAITSIDTTKVLEHQLSLIYLNLAETYETMYKLDEATANYMKAIEVDTNYMKAYTKAAAFNARYQSYNVSDSLYNKAISLGEFEANDYFNWGLSYMQRRVFSTGIDKMMSALKLDPDLFQAHYLIAVAYHEYGFPKDSVYKYLNQAIKLNPNFEQALRFQESLKN